MDTHPSMSPGIPLKPVSRKKSRLQPIRPDALRRTQTGFGVSDQTKAMQMLLDENDHLKKELEEAKKEIFRLKEENLELKKGSKGGSSKGQSTFLTSSTIDSNGNAAENSKENGDEKVCNN